MHPVLMQIQAIGQGSYPDWIWQRNPPEKMDHIPVFRFHSAEPEYLEAQLRFLKKNGYETVTTNLFYDSIMGRKNMPERAVMLTFDDGRRCVRETVFPLLKQFGMKAVIFICPAIIKGSGDSPTLSWNEIREMHDSGLIDVQAHSHYHQRIPVSSEVVDFVNPRLLERYYFKFEIPFYQGTNPGEMEPNDILGAPVYRSLPFLREFPMYLEDPALRSRCIEAVQANGGQIFFQQKDWRKSLMKIVHAHQNSNEDTRHESMQARENRISACLSLTIEKIELILKGHRVRHLAYPWGIGSDMAISCSRKLGYLANFWSTLPHRRTNRSGDNPFYMVRLKHDFIWRLPGVGRHGLAELFMLKVRRRMSSHFEY